MQFIYDNSGKSQRLKQPHCTKLFAEHPASASSASQNGTLCVPPRLADDPPKRFLGFVQCFYAAIHLKCYPLDVELQNPCNKSYHFLALHHPTRNNNNHGNIKAKLHTMKCEDRDEHNRY
jgi:hypothetical protein